MFKPALTAIFMAGSLMMPVQAQEVFGDTFGDGVAAYTLQYYEDARRIWTPLAKAGNADAAWRLADLYERGLGGDRDPEMAARLIKQASDAGHGQAMKQYVELVGAGRGVDGDADESLRLVRKAAGQGHSWAAWQMGARYLKGNGVEKDKAASLAWFKCAAGGKGSDTEKARAGDMAKRLEAVLLDSTIERSKSVRTC